MIYKFNTNKTKQLDAINKLLSLFIQKPVCKSSFVLAEVSDILIVDFALIGDMIMNIPFLKNIRFNCPNASITMVCMPWAEVVLSDQGLVDEFIIFNGKEKLSSLKQLFQNRKEIKTTLQFINKKEYQIGIEPKGDLRHILFMHYTSCKRTITYNYTGGNYLVTDSFKPLSDTKHLIDEKLDLLNLAGFIINSSLTIPELKISDKLRVVVDQFVSDNNLRGYKIIGIHPGASNVNKQYKYYPQVVAKIASLCGEFVRFCVFEGDGEEKIVNDVCCVLSEKQYVRIKRPLKEYISLVSICDYMLCNDSAAGHIAAAYGIPSLIIFGPIKDETAAPRGRGRIITISKEYDCKPCTLPTCPLGTEECIKSVGVDEVIEKFCEMVGNELSDLVI